MTHRRRTEWAYVLAFVLPVAALLARLAMGDSAGNRPGLILFIVPIALCAYWGGLCPGLACTVFSALVSVYFLSGAFTPAGHWSSFDAAAWLTFLVAGVVISYLAEQLHQSQERIHRSEARLTGIFNASMDAIIILDKALNILYINPATEKMFGYQSAELLRASILRLIPQAEHARDLAILRSVTGDTAYRKFSSGPATGLRADGTAFPVEAAFTQIDVEGRPQFLLELRDVTRHKAAEDALRKSEAIYRGLFESLDEGVVLWNPDGRIAACNASAERILGYSVERMVGLHYSEIPWRPRDPNGAQFDPDQLSVAVIQRTGEPMLQRERRLTRGDGVEIWTLQTGVPLRLGDENGTPHVIVAFTDITEARSRTAMISQMANIVANSQDAIISKDVQGIITTWNPGAQMLLGFAAEETIGQSFAQLLMSPAHHPSEQRIRERVTAGEHIEAFELVLLCKDRHPVHVSVTASALRDANLQITGVSIIARDITQRRRMEDALRERDAATEANRLKSEFLANMSHELRTPLTGIIGFTEYLAASQAGPINDEQKESLDTIYKSGMHLLDLINGLLDLSKIEAGKMELLPETFAVREVVDEVCDSLSQMAQRKRISVSRAVAAEVATVTLDRGKFKQVLYNLVSNAVKFTHDGGSVAVQVVPEKTGRLALRVTDTGIGIDPKDVDKLFQNFHQLDSGNARRREGAGLGLALTKKIVELQHGIITVESAPGEGSVFTVILPHVAADPA